MFSQSQSFNGKSMFPSFLPWDQVESAANGGGKFRWRDQLQCVHQRLPGRATMVRYGDQGDQGMGQDPKGLHSPKWHLFGD